MYGHGHVLGVVAQVVAIVTFHTRPCDTYTPHTSANKLQKSDLRSKWHMHGESPRKRMSLSCVPDCLLPRLPTPGFGPKSHSSFSVSAWICPHTSWIWTAHPHSKIVEAPIWPAHRLPPRFEPVLVHFVGLWQAIAWPGVDCPSVVTGMLCMCVCRMRVSGKFCYLGRVQADCSQVRTAKHWLR